MLLMPRLRTLACFVFDEAYFLVTEGHPEVAALGGQQGNNWGCGKSKKREGGALIMSKGP